MLQFVLQLVYLVSCEWQMYDSRFMWEHTSTAYNSLCEQIMSSYVVVALLQYLSWVIIRMLASWAYMSFECECISKVKKMMVWHMPW